jgi:HEPN domain-containing protein
MKTLSGAVLRLNKEEKGGFDSGAPRDFYMKEEAEKAIQCAEKILDFCRRQVG